MYSEHLIHTNYRTNRDLTNSGDPCFHARLLGQVQTQFIVIGKEIETMAHVLVVDDEAEIRFLIRRVLESASHNVFEAGDGSAALNILEPPHPINVIVLDIQMPRMDGIEFLSILHKQISYPPTIVLTAHREQFQKVFEPKVNGYLTKPFKTRDLIDMVNSQVNVHIGQPLP
jgi:CheY-like chemotaxis protein